MNVPTIILLVWFALSALVTVATVGKPREPMSPGSAALALFFTGVMAWLVVIA